MSCPPHRLEFFQQQMGGGWGGCGMRSAGNAWGLQAFLGCFGVHCKEKDDCWCHIIHLAVGEAAFGVKRLLENAQELSWSSPSKGSCQLNDVEEEGLLLQLWFSSAAVPSLLTVLSPRQCFTTALSQSCAPAELTGSESLWSTGAVGKQIPHPLLFWVGSQSSSLCANKNLTGRNPSGSSALHLLAWISPASEIQAFESNLC